MVDFQFQLDKWTEIINNGGSVDVIYLDLVKACDLVPISVYRKNYSLVHWITRLLLGRQQRVMIARTGSDWAFVLSGVPQESVGY